MAHYEKDVKTLNIYKDLNGSLVSGCLYKSK